MLLKKEGVAFDQKDNRIACYPHIINICVSHIVSSLTNVSVDDSYGSTFGEEYSSEDDDGGYVGEDTDEDEIDMEQYAGDLDLEKWFEAVKRNPVQRARVVVRTVRSSGQRKEDFASLIRTWNESGLFKDDDGKAMKVKELQLLKDVKHRWDSLYLMLSRLEQLQQVFLIQYSFVITENLVYQPVDAFFKADRVLRSLMLTEEDWDVLAGLRVVLEVRLS